MRATDLTGIATTATGALLAFGSNALQLLNNNAPALGVMIAFLTFIANIYFQIQRRKHDKQGEHNDRL